ncbi:MAG: ATP-binding cassette domain-containing protein [Acidimicrobiales bacterium]
MSELMPLLEMRNITKRFPGVLANDNVSFDVLPGEVHTLLGENGAGKSTLMKILFGLYLPDEGEILLRGAPTQISSPISAIEQRVGMVHQHFMLVPTLTVAENVALGLSSNRGIRTDLDTVSKRIMDISEHYGLAVDPGVEIWKMSVGERQRVEIIKALYRDAELLVLDEPTAVLTPQVVDDLFVILR